MQKYLLMLKLLIVLCNVHCILCFHGFINLYKCFLGSKLFGKDNVFLLRKKRKIFERRVLFYF